MPNKPENRGTTSQASTGRDWTKWFAERGIVYPNPEPHPFTQLLARFNKVQWPVAPMPERPEKK